MAKWAPDDRAQLHRDANKALDEHLQPGEEVQVIIRGTYSSAMIGTDRRAFVFKKGMFSRGLATFEYRETSGVAYQAGMMLGHVALQGPGLQAGSEIEKAPHAIQINEKDQAQAGVAILRRLIGQAQQSSPAAAEPGGPDIPEQLRKLAELRDGGILTTEEFEAKKADLLSRM